MIHISHAKKYRDEIFEEATRSITIIIANELIEYLKHSVYLN